MEKREESRFIKGLICGVLLTLVCMAGWTAVYRINMNRRIEQMRTGMESGSDETAGENKEQPAEQSDELQISGDAVLAKISELQNIINSVYRGEIDSDQVEEYIYVGLVAGLQDPYSEYFPKQERKQFEEETTGAYTGIGAVFQQDPKTKEIQVVTCYEGTAAEEAGLQAGDVICSVDGEDVRDMELDEVVGKIRADGLSSVNLGIRRGEEEMDIAVEVRRVEINTTDEQMLEDQIGYLRISEFDDVTTDQVKRSMEELEDQGMEKLVIDLRGNPGGVLEVVCDVADLFLPEGLIVYMEDKNGEREEFSSDAVREYDIPLAVLIDGDSASASEVFAGAVKDYAVGTLVGTTTFGKGIVQSVFDLSDGTAVKLTTAKYFTPKGNDIHEKGIEPDVEVEQTGRMFDPADPNAEEDSQLQEALRILRAEADM